MKAREVAEIATLRQMAIETIPKTMSSIQYYQMEGVKLALDLMLLMASDSEKFAAEKAQLFRHWYED